jgi:acetyl-CoA acetyltransferase
MTPERTLRGRAAIAGIGESTYYRHGRSPESEFVLALRAILAAAEDAGIDPRQIDGFSSYSWDRNGPVRLAAALGLHELRFGGMVWEGGGGGMAASIGNAAAAVATGQADVVVAFRALAQGEFGRFGRSGANNAEESGEYAFIHPYGIFSPGQTYAPKYTRWMHEHGGIGLSAQKAVSLASYHHAQNNPRAVMQGRMLTSEDYDASRWIVEPWRLFDFCQENDGAAAVIVVSPERAKDLKQRPVYLLGVAQGADQHRGSSIFNSPTYASSTFTTLAPQLWKMSGVKPSDVDVVQSYENFTGGVVMSLVEHGLVDAEAVDEVLTVENLTAPHGKLPLNTSGGNLAEAYIHGLELAVEGVRQLRDQSCNQVESAQVALVSAGPLTSPVSTLVLGSEATL